jgi:pyruvate,water dikinase
MDSPPAPKSIPLPADFPVTWEAPDEPFLPWQQDRQHAPKATVPMSDAIARHFAEGASAACQALGAPVQFRSRLFNYYYYMAIAPSVPPEEMATAEMAAIPGILQMSTVADARWNNEWLPELKSTWERWCSVDTRTLDGAALLSRYDEFVGLYRRCWQIHFELLIPLLVGFSEFMDFHRRHLGGEADLDATKMVQGLDNLSLEAGRRMWALSRALLASPLLAATVRDGGVESVYERLGQSEEGRRFRAEVDAYLQEFGLRSDTVQDLSDPSWLEEPGRFFSALRPYLENDTDPDIRHRELAAEREAAVAAARQALAAGPAGLREQFEALLKAGQSCSWLQEDHNHWIDQRSLYEARRLVLEIGERLAARGQAATPEDALYLFEEELRQAIAEPGFDVRPLAGERRREKEHFAGVAAPPMIGTDYGPPPMESPVARAIGRFFGVPPAPPVAGEVRGTPGAPGTYRGVARITPTLEEVAHLGLGEIIVTPTTSPPWTPYFATAGAVVTETGGPISHCAIVAREYGIPAVVGAALATQQIRDGQVIEVDGDAGVVRLLD